MRTLRFLGLAGVLLAMGMMSALAQEPPVRKKPGESDPGRRSERGDRVGRLKEGDTAPLFVLKDMSGKRTVRLADLQGKPVVLFFGSCT